MHRTSRRRTPVVLAGLLALTTALAACGSSGSNKSSSDTKPAATTPQTAVQTTDLGQGVTNDSVKVGVVLIDYDSIAQFIDFKRGDQKKIFQSFVDDINANGGVAGGKKIDPVYVSYKPFTSADATATCTKLTEDDKVFAVIGVIIDATGVAQVCMTKQHKTTLITHELSESIMKKATPGLLLTSDALAERTIRTMLDTANQQNLLKDKKVGIVAETGTKSRINDAIKPELEKLKVPVGSTGVLATGQGGSGTPDTTAAQAQLDSLIERWKGEGTNAVFISGLTAVSKVFVTAIKKAMPDAVIFADGDSSAKGAAQDAVNSKTNPNPYDGLISLTGLTDQQQFELPSVQKCVGIWEKTSGTKVVAPKDLKAGKDGKRDEIWITVRDACADLDFFKQIADRVGKNLNNHNWTDTVNHFGSIPLVGSSAGTLQTGKYDANNAYALVSFDPTAGTSGDWKQLTPVSGGSTTETTTANG
jgi:hypothetical protein